MTGVKRLGRRLVIGMGLTLGALALVLALLYGFAQSQAGRTWIARNSTWVEVAEPPEDPL